MWNPVSIIRRRRSEKRETPRGQILIIFASMLTILLLFSALVVDLGWLWSNTLRVQRAADAAALAGVVHLPSDVPGAYFTARAEATKNGYSDGSSGVTVTPLRDPDISRRLDVFVQAPVKTWFLGLIGMDTVTISRKAQADYVLPVPMGSPQNYYGVGDFRSIMSGSPTNTGLRRPTANHGPNGWTNPEGAWDNGGAFASGEDGKLQGYGDFGFSIPGGSVISGIEVRVKARSTDDGCEIGVATSWDDGSSWTTKKLQALTGGFVSPFVLGGPNDDWGHAWLPGQLADGKFVVRVSDEDPGVECEDNARTDLDALTVIVYYSTAASDRTSEVMAPNGSPLCTLVPPDTSCSQGFWGAVFTKGGVRQNGDRYSPANYSGGSSAANPDYDSGGYNYSVEVGGGGGSVSLFDATFCGTGQTSFGGWYGAGDHWTSRPNPPGGNGYGGVTTRYRLYNTNGTDYNLLDDALVADSGPTFANENQTDQSGNFGSPQRTTANGASNCASNPYHNGWYGLAGGLAGGKYRLNVNTSDPANDNIAAENLFSIHVNSSGKPRVYGGGRMAAYTNLKAGTQRFYLAQIERAHAGKTMDITLFDPGDVSGDAYLRILSPDGNAYNYATFDYTSDAECTGVSDACSATGRTQIKTHGSGGSSFDNSVLSISIPLPSTYGSVGLTPTGETEAGWWKIEYEVAGGNDTTTWEVSIRGNPVRLVVP